MTKYERGFDMAWIQIHQTLKDHKKLLEAADLLDIEPPHMMGLLISLWLWAIDNAPDGNLGDISPRIIARAAQWNGDPDIFLSALKTAKWLDENEDSLDIHDWYDYTGKLIEQRIAERERSRKRRLKSAEKPSTDQQTSGGRPQDDQQTTGGRVEKSKVDNSKEEEKKEHIDPKESVPYEKIRELFNATCPSFAKVLGINGKRKIAVAARWKEHPDLDFFKEYFERVEASDFLKGKNDRNWKATFDWLMNAANMDKVREGKYGGDRGGNKHGIGVDKEHSGKDAGSFTLSGFKMATEDDDWGAGK